MDSTVANNDATATPTDGHGAALFAGFLGWTLDAFDFFLVVLSLTAIAQEFHRSDKEIALSITLTLAFRPVGAFIFGLMADRYGRRIPLMIDLVFYSVVEVATGFAHSFATFWCCARCLALAWAENGASALRSPWRKFRRGCAAFSPGCCSRDTLSDTFWRRAATSLSFRAGDGGLCFLSEGFPLCSGFSSALR